MGILQVPENYESDYGIIKKAGLYIAELGKKILIVGGNTALGVVQEELIKGLEAYNIQFDIIYYSGYPTQKKANELADKIRTDEVQVIVGVGGGKILDLVKAAGFYANVPVVTIPTIAATCAAWSGLSVLYTDQGEQDIYLYVKEFPKLVIADKKILRNEPIRYLNSGVADTIVKWYELYPDLKNHPENFALRLQLKVCELALEYLKTDYVQAYINGTLFQQKNREIVDHAIDSIIMLAGLAGSIKGSIPYGGLAHPLYNASTFIKETHHMLHGEKVIFGLLVQMTLEKREKGEIVSFIKWMRKLELPTSLEEIGIRTQDKDKVKQLAKRIKSSVGDYEGLDFEISAEDIESAIWTVNEIGKRRKIQSA